VLRDGVIGILSDPGAALESGDTVLRPQDWTTGAFWTFIPCFRICVFIMSYFVLYLVIMGMASDGMVGKDAQAFGRGYLSASHSLCLYLWSCMRI
jgi:hypothetical protein